MAQPSRRPRAALPLALAVVGATSLFAAHDIRNAEAAQVAAAAQRSATLRTQVVDTFRQVQARSGRLGLDRPRALTLARRVAPLRRQLRHWQTVRDFLTDRRELEMGERERVSAAKRRPARERDRLRREVRGHYQRSVERSSELGVTRPAPLRIAKARPAVERQRDHWRSVSEFLLQRREMRRGPELTPRWHAWMCIHSHEGPWDAATGNGYYGGLQMDWNFMRAYGAHLLRAKGPANNWTPTEQVMVADRAWRTRGFYPWPNTARMCGLI